MAFAVGEFDYVECLSKEGVVCRVYTPKGKQDRGRFALYVVSKSLTVYKDYFGVAYPLPKMDLLAVNEFPCGAMVSRRPIVLTALNMHFFSLIRCNRL
jgi:puromycin-sensitive aminopeptidase